MEIQTQTIARRESHSRSNGATTLAKVSALLHAWLCLCCLMVVSCGGGKSPTAPSPGTSNTGTTGSSPTLTTVRVSGSTGANVGDKVQLTADAIYSDGSTAAVTTQAAWSSGTPAVATVNASGMVTAISAGTTSIQASFEGQAGTRMLEIRKAADVATLKEVRVSRADCTEPCQPPHPSDRVQMKAEAVYSDRSTIDVTTRGTWSSSSPGDASVDSTGLVTAINPNKRVDISAKFENVTGSYTLQTVNEFVNGVLDVQRFECIGDCEGFTQGAGDFTYNVSILEGDYWRNDVVSQKSLVRLAAGESRTIDERVSFALYDRPAEEFHIKFCATEWDLGNVPDSNMNNRCSSAVYRWSADRWVPEGANYITLGSGSCRVRLHYRISSVVYTKPR